MMLNDEHKEWWENEQLRECQIKRYEAHGAQVEPVLGKILQRASENNLEMIIRDQVLLEGNRFGHARTEYTKIVFGWFNCKNLILVFHGVRSY